MSKYRLSRKYSHYPYALLPLILFAAGCGGGYSAAPTTPAAPSVSLSSNSVAFPATTQGVSSAPMMVAVTNNGMGALTISSVATGGSNPGDFTNTNTCTAAVSYLGTCTISVTFVPTAVGPRSETITLTDNAPNSPQVINVTGTANAIAINLSPAGSAIGTAGGMSFVATGDQAGVTWSVSGAPFRGSPDLVTSPGMIDANGNYIGPGGAQSFYATVTATSKTDPTKSAFANINVVAPGVFTTTNNVQVAQYTVTPPSPASASVQFGLTTSYGLATWTQPTTTLGSSVSLFVAGMKQSTPYHMQGLITFQDGSQFTDADQTFTAAALPAGTAPTMTTTTTAGMTPQSGVEFLELISTVVSTKSNVAVTDLGGNILWTYNGGPAGFNSDPMKLMPNGHILINFTGPTNVPDGQGGLMQEVDLGGNLIWQMTAAQLNTALAAATCAGCNITIVGTHHDFVMLPNGHLIVIASTQQVVSGTTVTGDVIIDVGDIDNAGGNNPNHVPQPVWLWNSFTHLDVNRHPYLFPDWTHTNAVIYSKDDGNLIISMRHQNWLVKIDYNNGAGAGDILWHLGYQGDFTLLNADGSADTTATDWFFAQHGPAFVSSNTTGEFSLVLFDNGDDRGVAVPVTGGTCGVAGQPACFSTVPIFDIDETAKTAKFVINPTTQDYSFFGGNAETLANGNFEYDECSDGSLAGTNASVFEVTQSSTPQTVWKMQVTGQYAYRGIRTPSLYPGVQW